MESSHIIDVEFGFQSRNEQLVLSNIFSVELNINNLSTTALQYSNKCHF
jgi:hypothetical protein